jgi:hypothetical protein
MPVVGGEGVRRFAVGAKQAIQDTHCGAPVVPSAGAPARVAAEVRSAPAKVGALVTDRCDPRGTRCDVAFVLAARGGVDDSLVVGFAGLGVFVLCAAFAVVGGVLERRARRRGW